jgi:uncharacterized membrane protein
MIGYDIALKIHVALGVLALSAFWTIALLRKGTRLHRRIGGTYLIAMIGVTLTALPLAGGAFAAGRNATGVFLLYLVLITASALWIARRAVRSRQSAQLYIGGSYRPVAWANLAGGTLVLIIGIYFGEPLLWGMSLIGLIVGLRMLRFAAHPPTTRGWWLQPHYIGMTASGIASHIAFLNIGLQRMVPPNLAAPAHYIAWFGPVVVAAFAIVWLDRRYGRGGANMLPAEQRATGQSGIVPTGE